MAPPNSGRGSSGVGSSGSSSSAAPPSARRGVIGLLAQHMDPCFARLLHALPALQQGMPTGDSSAEQSAEADAMAFLRTYQQQHPASFPGASHRVENNAGGAAPVLESYLRSADPAPGGLQHSQRFAALPGGFQQEPHWWQQQQQQQQQDPERPVLGSSAAWCRRDPCLQRGLPGQQAQQPLQGGNAEFAALVAQLAPTELTLLGGSQVQAFVNAAADHHPMPPARPDHNQPPSASSAGRLHVHNAGASAMVHTSRSVAAPALPRASAVPASSQQDALAIAAMQSASHSHRASAGEARRLSSSAEADQDAAAAMPPVPHSRGASMAAARRLSSFAEAKQREAAEARSEAERKQRAMAGLMDHIRQQQQHMLAAKQERQNAAMAAAEELLAAASATPAAFDASAAAAPCHHLPAYTSEPRPALASRPGTASQDGAWANGQSHAQPAASAAYTQQLPACTEGANAGATAASATPQGQDGSVSDSCPAHELTQACPAAPARFGNQQSPVGELAAAAPAAYAAAPAAYAASLACPHDELAAGIAAGQPASNSQAGGIPQAEPPSASVEFHYIDTDAALLNAAAACPAQHADQPAERSALLDAPPALPVQQGGQPMDQPAELSAAQTAAQQHGFAASTRDPRVSCSGAVEPTGHPAEPTQLPNAHPPAAGAAVFAAALQPGPAVHHSDPPQEEALAAVASAHTIVIHCAAIEPAKVSTTGVGWTVDACAKRAPTPAKPAAKRHIAKAPASPCHTANALNDAHVNRPASKGYARPWRENMRQGVGGSKAAAGAEHAKRGPPERDPVQQAVVHEFMERKRLELAEQRRKEKAAEQAVLQRRLSAHKLAAEQSKQQARQTRAAQLHQLRPAWREPLTGLPVNDQLPARPSTPAEAAALQLLAELSSDGSSYSDAYSPSPMQLAGRAQHARHDLLALENGGRPTMHQEAEPRMLALQRGSQATQPQDAAQGVLALEDGSKPNGPEVAEEDTLALDDGSIYSGGLTPSPMQPVVRARSFTLAADHPSVRWLPLPSSDATATVEGKKRKSDMQQPAPRASSKAAQQSAEHSAAQQSAERSAAQQSAERSAAQRDPNPTARSQAPPSIRKRSGNGGGLPANSAPYRQKSAVSGLGSSRVQPVLRSVTTGALVSAARVPLRPARPAAAKLPAQPAHMTKAGRLTASLASRPAKPAAAAAAIGSVAGPAVNAKRRMILDQAYPSSSAPHAPVATAPNPAGTIKAAIQPHQAAAAAVRPLPMGRIGPSTGKAPAKRPARKAGAPLAAAKAVPHREPVGTRAVPRRTAHATQQKRPKAKQPGPKPAAQHRPDPNPGRPTELAPAAAAPMQHRAEHGPIRVPFTLGPGHHPLQQQLPVPSTHAIAGARQRSDPAGRQGTETPAAGMDRLHTDPQQAALLAVANLIGRRLAAPAVPEPRHKPQDQAVPADPRTSRQTRVREMMSRVLRLSDRIASLSSTQHPRLLPHSPQQDKTSIRRRDQPLVMRSLPALPITAHLSPARSRRAPSPSGDSQEGSLRSLQSSWVTQSSLLGSERSFSGSEQSLRGPLAAQENLQQSQHSVHSTSSMLGTVHAADGMCQQQMGMAPLGGARPCAQAVAPTEQPNVDMHTSESTAGATHAQPAQPEAPNMAEQHANDAQLHLVQSVNSVTHTASMPGSTDSPAMPGPLLPLPIAGELSQTAQAKGVGSAESETPSPAGDDQAPCSGTAALGPAGVPGGVSFDEAMQTDTAGGIIAALLQAAASVAPAPPCQQAQPGACSAALATAATAGTAHEALQRVGSAGAAHEQIPDAAAAHEPAGAVVSVDAVQLHQAAMLPNGSMAEPTSSLQPGTHAQLEVTAAVSKAQPTAVQDHPMAAAGTTAVAATGSGAEPDEGGLHDTAAMQEEAVLDRSAAADATLLTGIDCSAADDDASLAAIAAAPVAPAVPAMALHLSNSNVNPRPAKIPLSESACQQNWAIGPQAGQGSAVSAKQAKQVGPSPKVGSKAASKAASVRSKSSRTPSSKMSSATSTASSEGRACASHDGASASATPRGNSGVKRKQHQVAGAESARHAATAADLGPARAVKSAGTTEAAANEAATSDRAQQHPPQQVRRRGLRNSWDSHCSTASPRSAAGDAEDLNNSQMAFDADDAATADNMSSSRAKMPRLSGSFCLEDGWFGSHSKDSFDEPIGDASFADAPIPELQHGDPYSIVNIFAAQHAHVVQQQAARQGQQVQHAQRVPPQQPQQPGDTLLAALIAKKIAQRQLEAAKSKGGVPSQADVPVHFTTFLSEQTSSAENLATTTKCPGALLDGTQPAFQASDATRKLDPEAVLSRSVTGTVLISASLGAATALQPAAEATGAPKRPTNRQETPMRSSMEHSVVHSLAIPEQLDASFAGEETHAQAVRGAHSLAASVAASSLGPASAEYESDFEADASLVQSMRHSMQRSVDRSMEIPEQLDASFAASVVMEIADESRDDTMAKEAPTLPLNPTVASGHELPPALRLRLIADEVADQRRSGTIDSSTAQHVSQRSSPDRHARDIHSQAANGLSASDAMLLEEVMARPLSQARSGPALFRTAQATGEARSASSLPATGDAASTAAQLQWLSPAGLEAALQEEMQRLEEVHAMQVELDHMQHARALAAVHSEAERLAAAVDAQMTTEAQATRLQQLQEEQEGQLKAVTKGLKEQLRTEGLAHLRDLAATLRQELVGSASAPLPPGAAPASSLHPLLMSAAAATSASDAVELHLAQASGLGPAHPAANASMSDDAIEEERDVTSSIDDIIEEEDIVLEEQNFPLKDARVVGRMGGFTAGAQGVAKPQTGRYTAAAAASLASGGASSASSVLEEVAMWSAQGLPAGEPNQDTSYLARQFLADARRRLQEVDSAVQQALQQARATAQAKQAQLQAAVATAATDKQRRSAARGQKLLTMQLAMDTAELQRQLATARADFERQRLCWEQIRRSASDLGSATTTPIRSDHQTDHAGDLPSAQAQLAGADMLDSHAVAARLLAAQPQAELRAESSRDSMSAPGVSEADDLRLSSAAQSVSEVQYSEDFESTFDSPRSRQPVAWRPGRVESGELFDDSELDAQSAELEAAQQGLARLLAEKHKALQRQRREAALAAKSAAVAQMAASISSIDAEIEALKAGAAASLQPPVGPPGMAALTAIVPHPQHAAGSAELDIRGERSAATSVVEEELPSRRSQDVVSGRYAVPAGPAAHPAASSNILGSQVVIPAAMAAASECGSSGKQNDSYGSHQLPAGPSVGAQHSMHATAARESLQDEPSAHSLLDISQLAVWGSDAGLPAASPAVPDATSSAPPAVASAEAQQPVDSAPSMPSAPSPTEASAAGSSSEIESDIEAVEDGDSESEVPFYLRKPAVSAQTAAVRTGQPPAVVSRTDPAAAAIDPDQVLLEVHSAQSAHSGAAAPSASASTALALSMTAAASLLQHALPPAHVLQRSALVATTPGATAAAPAAAQLHAIDVDLASADAAPQPLSASFRPRLSSRLREQLAYETDETASSVSGSDDDESRLPDALTTPRVPLTRPAPPGVPVLLLSPENLKGARAAQRLQKASTEYTVVAAGAASLSPAASAVEASLKAPTGSAQPGVDPLPAAQQLPSAASAPLPEASSELHAQPAALPADPFLQAPATAPAAVLTTSALAAGSDPHTGYPAAHDLAIPRHAVPHAESQAVEAPPPPLSTEISFSALQRQLLPSTAVSAVGALLQASIDAVPELPKQAAEQVEAEQVPATFVTATQAHEQQASHVMPLSSAAPAPADEEAQQPADQPSSAAAPSPATAEEQQQQLVRQSSAASSAIASEVLEPESSRVFEPERSEAYSADFEPETARPSSWAMQQAASAAPAVALSPERVEDKESLTSPETGFASAAPAVASSPEQRAAAQQGHSMDSWQQGQHAQRAQQDAAHPIPGLDSRHQLSAVREQRADGAVELATGPRSTSSGSTASVDSGQQSSEALVMQASDRIADSIYADLLDAAIADVAARADEISSDQRVPAPLSAAEPDLLSSESGSWMRGRDEEPDRVHQEALTSTPHLAVTAATQPVVRVPDAVVVDQATVGEYVEAVMELFMQGPPDRVVPGQDLLGLEGFLLLERSRPAVSDAQHIHNKLLYDAVNEALVHFFSLAARRQPAPAWIRRLQPLRRLPQGPELTAAVKQRVMKWAAQQHDEHVDAMLAEDAVEDDRTWAIIEEEEAEVRFDISEAIWDDLIADTADTLLLLHG